VGNDDDLGDIVPVPLLQPRPLREVQPLSAFSFSRLLGRRVRLRVNGFDVTGEFRGADEDEVYLRGELRFFVYPLASVSGLTLLDDDAPREDDNDNED
jgi:hypothetical protein